jgi:hypothetical protein
MKHLSKEYAPFGKSAGIFLKSIQEQLNPEHKRHISPSQIVTYGYDLLEKLMALFSANDRKKKGIPDLLGERSKFTNFGIDPRDKSKHRRFIDTMDKNPEKIICFFNEVSQVLKPRKRDIKKETKRK